MTPAQTGNGLKRDIGWFTATVIVIANMVGTGIFTTSGFIMAELNTPRTLLVCWVVGGIFALCGALCYGELGARFPRAGGEYVFLKESFGRPMGFLSGWISLVVGFSAPIAAAAIAFTTYAFKAMGVVPAPGFQVTVGSIPLFSFSMLNLTAVAAIVLFSLIHYMGLKAGARVQNGLTLFKVTVILLFILCGMGMGHGSWAHFSMAASVGDTFSAEQFAVSLIFVSFSFSGWNAAAYLGGEIKHPRKNIPLALTLGTVFVIIVYLLLNGIYIYALPPKDMAGVLEVGGNSAIALFGAPMGGFFNMAVALGVLSALSAMIMAGPRVYYAMAKDHVFFDCFGNISEKRHTPAASIMLQGTIAVIMVITASFNALLIYIGFTLSLFALLTVVGLLRIRRQEVAGESPGGYRTFGYPFTPLFFIGGNLWIIIFSLKSKPVASLLGVGTIFAGMLFYAYFASRRDPNPQKGKEMIGAMMPD